MSEFVLTKPPGAPPVSESTLLRELWRATGPADSVEYIRVHLSRAGAKGVVFSVAADPEHARKECLALCRRALFRSPHLSDWTLVPAPG